MLYLDALGRTYATSRFAQEDLVCKRGGVACYLIKEGIILRFFEQHFLYIYFYIIFSDIQNSKRRAI